MKPTLTPQQQRMIDKAKADHRKIYPCGSCKKVEEGFTQFDNKIFFWFNTKGRNTHMIKEDRER